MSVYFGGSRNLIPGSVGWQAAQRVAKALVTAQQVVHVGCCTGADQAAIEALSGSSSLVVFAAYGPQAAGAWSGSAIQAVSRAASQGTRVHWWAGGGESVPLEARLIKRSRAALAGCSQAVFLWPGSGSLAVATHAIESGIPVIAVTPVCPALPSVPGRWVQDRFCCGVTKWFFQPAQAALF